MSSKQPNLASRKRRAPPGSAAPVPVESSEDVGTRGRATESEKITINLGSVDLGSIDLLVAEGFFSNRSDLIRTAVRNLLAAHREIINGALARQDRTL